MHWAQLSPNLPAAALIAAVGVYLVSTLPPHAIRIDSPDSSSEGSLTNIPGAFHVHTLRSDGGGLPDDIAAAAARAGLKFVIFTDHGDGTGLADPPLYRSGVLCIDGVEISTTGGHYIALNMKQAPYPLGGEPRDVVADVRRLGGVGIVAHPDSEKPALRWQDWSLVVDGFEWLNADSEWRDEGTLRLGRALFDYPFRPAQTLASLLDRPEESLARWDRFGNRPLVGLAGADAHGRIGLGGGTDPYAPGQSVPLPSYETSFRTFAIRIGLDEPLSGDALRDATALVGALRAGRVYTAIDAIAAPAVFRFYATADGALVPMGGRAPEAHRVELVARASVPPGGELVLLRNGRIVESVRAHELRHETDGAPASFRVEARLAGAPGAPPVPWIVSNPIYVGKPPADPEPEARPASLESLALEEEGPSRWTLERDRTSAASLEARLPDGARAGLRYELGQGEAGAPFVALRHRLPGGIARFKRLVIRTWADRPTRVSLQFRSPGNDGRRWQRSIYLDPEPRDQVIEFTELSPIIAPSEAGRSFDRIDSVLLVLDSVNAAPERSGLFWVGEVRFER